MTASNKLGEGAPLTQRPVLAFLHRRILWILVLSLCCCSGYEALVQRREDAFIRETALRVVSQAGAETASERVVALRAFVKESVRWEGAPGALGQPDTRPFLRASAAETLDTGLGYCGESSRVFINLSRSLGIESQRLNLYGPRPHVVAEIELTPEQPVVVDAQNPPQIEDLEPLDAVVARPDYDGYYSLNLRRLHLSWLISRVRLKMGPITYWTENPHALKAAMWGCAALLLMLLRFARAGVRYFLLRRGWVHKSSLLAPGERDENDAPRIGIARPT